MKWSSGGYFAATLVGAVSPLLVIPVTAEIGGRPGFSDFAIATAIGSTLGIVVNCGWGVSGPTVTARFDSPRQARDFLAYSVAVRVAAAFAGVPLAFTLAWLLADVNSAAAALYAAAGTVGGLSTGWYFVGLRRPGSLLLYDAAPRALGVLLSCLAAYYAGSLLVLGAGALAAELFVVTLACKVEGLRLLNIWGCRNRVRQGLLEQSDLMLSQFIGQSAVRLALPLLAVVNASPLALAQFAAGTRLTMLARTGLRPFLNLLQAWVAHDAPGRARRATRVTLGAGFFGAILALTVLPAAGHLIFRQAVTIDLYLAATVAAATLALAATYCASLYYLIPAGRTSVIAWSETVCSTLGLIAATAAGLTAGGLWALTAAASAQVSIAVWQWLAVSKPALLRTRRL